MISRADPKAGGVYSVARESGDTDTVDDAISSGAAELIGRTLYQNGRREWVLIRVVRPFDVPFVEWPSWSEAEDTTTAEDQIPPEELYKGGLPPDVEWLDDNIVKPVDELKKSLPSFNQFIVGAVAISALLIIITTLRKR